MANIKRLCVYCGASPGIDPAHREAAMRLGALLAKNSIGLVYGGGRVGLMGVMADAVMKGGGEVIGIIPGHLNDREIGNSAVTELLVVGNMHERKQKMADLADAFAVLPGGFGTLEEALETITWRQLGLHDKPILLIDVAGYWKPLLHLFDHVIAQGFARDGAELYSVVPGVEDVLPALAKAPQPHPAKTSLV